MTTDKNKLQVWWQKLSVFLHHADIVPMIILASVYHYFQVLQSHDPILISAPLAIGVDLMHFRIIQKLVRSKRGVWLAPAIITTAIAYSLQFIFYSASIGSVALPLWQAITYASIVPLSITFLAWLRESDLQADDKRESEKLTEVLTITQAQLSELQGTESKLKQAELQLNSTESKLKQAESTRQALELQMNALEMAGKVLKKLNPTARAVAINMVTGDLSQKELAESLKTNQTAVSRLQKSLNGSS